MDYEPVRNLPTMFFDQAERYADRPFLWSKRDAQWRSQSWSEVAARISELSRTLRTLGVEPGDRVALVSENRPAWLIADVAIMAAGAITVPAYTTNSEDDHHFLLNDSGAKGLIISTRALAKRALPAAMRTPATEFAICLEAPEPMPGQGLRIYTWEEALQKGRDLADDVRDFAAKPQRTDTCCLIYTSGTGGQPKGVMLSHGAIICNCMGACQIISALPGFQEPGEVFLSFLPLSHAYEHTAGQFFPMSIGAEIYYAESLEKLVANIAEARPTIMTAVPRLYESIYARILRGLKGQSAFRQKLFMKAVALGRKRCEDPDSLSVGERLQDALLDKLVRKKVAGRFGGRLKAFVSGGAALNYEIGVFFVALGVRLLQGYGQTEAAPVISVNRHEPNKLDTVGPPLKGVEVRIADDGEILVRGELLMNGYWNNPEATAEALKDGWLHTGDIGRIDNDGYIAITDRKKDIIVNSGGDNVSPQRIEGMLTVEPEIAQVMVCGDKRPHLVALIVPDEDFAAAWLAENNRNGDLAALIGDTDFIKAIGAAVDRVSRKLSVVERIRKFILTAESFTIDNGMLTPSMKIRRHIIRDKYGNALDSLYGK
ncbi:MAG: long-chain fatty acid--CoA ligase [Gammaproteobacteria bacterium]|nr:long-chain fatty acid--CoA ligase [Gammaproteobacteria bacterium]